MSVIFHLTLASELAEGSRGGLYVPRRFEADGFVHCTGDLPTLLEVARAYFSGAEEPVLVLTLEVEKLKSPVRFEPPSPLPGGGGAHRTPGRLFPHVYGPIELGAVVERTELVRAGEEFRWPR